MLIRKKKYKIILKSKRVIENFPLKLKRLKRSKWKLFLNKNKYRFKIKRYKFKDFSLKSYPTKRFRFVRMKRYYKESLVKRTHLHQMYDNSFCFNTLRKKKVLLNKLKYFDLVKSILIERIFNLKILLWSLHFFTSTKQAAQFIDCNYIFVNNKNVRSNYLLKLGDIITFCPSIFRKKRLKKKHVDLSRKFKAYKMYPKLHSYLEIDFYTCSVVVLKTLDTFTTEDFSCLFSRSFNIGYVYNNVIH
jgi:ribosomal protein S4